METASETTLYNGTEYRLSDLCVGKHDLHDTLDQLDEYGFQHKVEKFEGVDVTDWPEQVDGHATVFAVYIPEVAQTTERMFASGAQ